MQPGDYVPAGTKISVYTEDGQTLLYSYTTTADNGPTIVPDDPLGMDVNTGYIPFNQQLIYTDYSSAYPNGATVFNLTDPLLRPEIARPPLISRFLREI